MYALLMRQSFPTQATLLNYLSHYYTPRRMVLAGVGVDHEELVSLAEEHVVNQVGEVNSLIGISITWHGMLCNLQKPVWNCQAQCDESTAQYTGGLVSIEKDLQGWSKVG